ncbi:histidine phosphatase family protein [Algoriphagus sp. H41]|uniref:Histidine phosphatase family protein n=1 Tax=Algoriphagus oliviformis TaxID=2811231 RepID=A0ABS3C749_9BACT|nr:histidine phosphatase family protein [Algoriphagus oliviformis]MBN7812396.1 histidine phosphatase family protein [Algoriphagus oliviformis]
MKKIILVRHAKSAWDNPTLSDHDRPLAERGLKDAPKMAKRLKQKGLTIDLMLSSSAVRAMETAKILAKELGYPKEKIKTDGKLYHATPHTLLSAIRSQSDEIKTMLVFGHNPGFNDLIDYLGGEIDNLPTSGQFGFILKSGNWRDLQPENVEVWFVDYPKKNS